jgi:large subunit ribosomal protein L19
MATGKSKSAENDTSYKDPVETFALSQMKEDIPSFRSGDTVRVHNRIIEGTKERIQVFEGVIIKRHKNNRPNASFTVRKVSYNIGVERTFMLHSPHIAKIEVVNRGKVRRSRLFYLRPLRGKATRIRTKMDNVKSSEAEQ